MLNLKSQTQIALVYFILAAGLGVVLRTFVVFEIPINYKFIVHTHSHIALLGWVYVALTTLIYKIVRSPKTDRRYRKIFWFTQFTLVGMLLTFPFQGYALFSIIFSTLFLFASYAFFWFFKKHVKQDFKKSNSYKCINIALWYMVFSSLGPWALGAIMNTLGTESVLYRMAIYFYLHFQYNGWMILTLFGFFLYLLEQHQLVIEDRIFKKFFWCLNLGIVLSFFLSALWTEPPAVFYILGFSGALFQLLGLLILFLAGPLGKIKKVFSAFQWGLFKVVLVLLTGKMLLQMLTAMPYFAKLASTILDFTIGYLHWTFFGVITMGIFLFLDYFRLIKLQKSSVTIYLIGFTLTEGLIFYKGIRAWLGFPVFEGYSLMLSLSSLALVSAIFNLLIVAFKRPGPFADI